ncbi:MAG: aldehyde dehydrogenase family protein, partial [Planctomycetota bacterium]
MATSIADFETVTIHDQVRAFLDKPHKLLIDGRWEDAGSGLNFEVLNPSDGSVLTHVAHGDAADVDRAVAAARRAFDEGPWRRMSGRERGRILYKLADL